MRFGAKYIKGKWLVWDYKESAAATDPMSALSAIRLAYRMSQALEK